MVKRVRTATAAASSQNGSLPIVEWSEELPRYSRDSIGDTSILDQAVDPERFAHLRRELFEPGLDLALGGAAGEIPDRFIRDGQLAQVIQQLILGLGTALDLQRGDLSSGRGQNRVRQMGEILAFGRRARVSPDLALGRPEIIGSFLFNVDPHLVDIK